MEHPPAPCPEGAPSLPEGGGVPIENVNVQEDWTARLHQSVRHMVDGVRDFRWFNVGDSIATGEWGIASTTEHFAAVGARSLGERLGVSTERRVHTAGSDFSGGAVELSGAFAAASGDFFGSAGWFLRPGARLRYRPDAGASRYLVSASGDVQFSVDDGVTWTEAEGAISRLERPAGSEGLLIGAGTGGARVHRLEYASPATAMTWYTSGIGGSRIADLHGALSAEGGRGYAAYGASEPDLLSIHIGVNDTIHADEVALEQSVSGLRGVLQSFLDAGVRTILLVGANPVRSDFQPGPWGQGDAVSKLYGPVAEEFGVPLVDVARRWVDYPAAHAKGFLVDQVHPTARGHEDIAALVVDLF